MATSSADWLDTYMTALDVRDSYEQADANIYDAYTKLADHTAGLSAVQRDHATAPTAQIGQPEQQLRRSPPLAGTPPPRSILGIATGPIRGSPPAPAPTEQAPDTIAATQLQAELSVAQRSRTTQAAQLAAVTAQLTQLQAAHDVNTASLSAMARDKSALERRLKDRDSELREKRSMLENVQDELVGLEMQVNVAEQQLKDLRDENEGLVRRLVQTREVEVDRVNRESGWTAERH